jgi:hypothetical protein
LQIAVPLIDLGLAGFAMVNGRRLLLHCDIAQSSCGHSL